MTTTELNVHISEQERAILEAASEQANTSLSDYVRRRAVEAAESDMFERRIVTIPAKNWDPFERWAHQLERQLAPLNELTARALDSGTVAPPRPLAEDDDRSEFDCGRASLNKWFYLKAWEDQDAGFWRITVICDHESGNIVGYVALSMAKIERAGLLEPQQRDKPDPVPVTLLGQLAVQREYQGQGHARSLLLFALRTAVRLAREVGSFGVVTHPIDDGVRAFYRRWGFEELSGDLHRAMIVRTIDLEASGIAG